MTDFPQIAFFVIVAACALTYADFSPACDIKELDVCSAKMIIIGDRDLIIPRNKQEVLGTCKDVVDNVSCIRNYTKRCLDPLRRQLINLYAESGRRLQKKYCETPQGLEKILKYLPCADKVVDSTAVCMERVIKEFEEIGKAASQSRIGMMCCRFSDYKECVLDAVKAGCDEDLIPLTDEFISTSVGDFMDLVCIGYEPDSEACKAFPRPDVEGRDALSVSVVPPVLKILEDFI